MTCESCTLYNPKWKNYDLTPRMCVCVSFFLLLFWVVVYVCVGVWLCILCVCVCLCLMSMCIEASSLPLGKLFFNQLFTVYSAYLCSSSKFQWLYLETLCIPWPTYVVAYHNDSLLSLLSHTDNIVDNLKLNESARIRQDYGSRTLTSTL